MMVPAQIFIIPQYLMISSINMTNTIFALVFPGLVTAFGTFLLRQSYMGLPKDLEEAARLDGCNIGQTFLFIMAPLTRSAMVALGIFTAVFAFKDLMWPMIINTDKNMLVLSSALAKMQGQYTANYPQLMAASLISCLPMIVIYLIFQLAGVLRSESKSMYGQCRFFFNTACTPAVLPFTDPGTYKEDSGRTSAYLQM